MFKFPNQISSVPRLWSLSWRLYIKSFPKIWIILGTLWLLSFYFLIGNFIGPENKNLLLLINQTPHALLKKLPYVWFDVYIVGAIIYCILFLYLLAVLLHRMYGLSIPRGGNLIRSFKIVKEKFWTIFLNQCLVLFLVILVYVPMVIPGFFLFGLLMFGIPLILFENCKVTEAIKNSFNLVWGHWWKVFIVTMMPLFINFCLNAVGYWLFGWSFFVSTALFHGLALKSFLIILHLFGGFVILPWSCAALLVQFNDLRVINKAK